MGASRVGSTPEATMSCIAPALEGSREVGEIWTPSTGGWVRSEYCELSNGGTAARFSSTWGGAGTDGEGASGLVKEGMVNVSSRCWTVRGYVVGAIHQHHRSISEDRPRSPARCGRADVGEEIGRASCRERVCYAV